MTAPINALRGHLTATALMALAPAARTFRRGRDFAVWLGLVPLPHSSGGKERLGRTTRMGERSRRRLLILPAALLLVDKHASLGSGPEQFSRMLRGEFELRN